MKYMCIPEPRTPRPLKKKNNDNKTTTIGIAANPASWRNPADVEFVYISCAAFNCWVEPRCNVESVAGNKVALRQSSGNSSCWHRLYYFGDGWGGKPEGKAPYSPTSIENVFDPSNFTAPGTFYYDRAAATFTYMPRAGETVATLEASATTATGEVILSLKGASNVVWQGAAFQYATSLHASGDKGFVDTQSAYLYHDGEPPVNIAVVKSTNIKFLGCTFQHLGGVYALCADGGSQDVIVANSTFSDCSGGGVKLGDTGERGAPAPSASLPVEQQDRGFLISDNFMDNIPVRFKSYARTRVCMCVCLCLSLPLSRSLALSLFLSLSVCLSVSLSVCVCMFVSMILVCATLYSIHARRLLLLFRTPLIPTSSTMTRVGVCGSMARWSTDLQTQSLVATLQMPS